MNATTKDPLHTTLRRQLRRLQLDDGQPPGDVHQWRELLFSIDRAYREADELVYLVTNAGDGGDEQLARSQQALAVAQRLNGLGSWTCELDSGVVGVSDELARLLGHDGGAMTLPIEQMIDLVHPADRQIAMHLLRSASSSATNRAGEIRFMTIDGVERRCLCRVASFANGAGKVVRIDGTVLDISERRAAEERTRQAGRSDPLTGLSNRAQFMRVLAGVLEQSRDTQHRAGVALIDLDGFEGVRDSCGGGIADALLETIARRLRSCLRGTDTVTRLGDAEFVLLIKDVGSDDNLNQVTARILRACSTSVSAGDRSIGVSASVGVAVFPADGQDAAQLIQSADAARLAAKQSGRDSVRLFGDEVHARRQSDRALAASLRTAISCEQISVAYQPIVDGDSLRIVGTEALARWSHPTLGPVSPAEFVQLAEQNGMIGELSSHVIHEACSRLAGLPRELASRCLAVNLSLVQLRSAHFVDQFESTLRECGVHPSRLRVEVAEAAIMEDREHAVRTLTRLREMGMSVWLDDFGGGHSSLAGLRQLPVDGIKIDRSLVSAIEGSQVGPALQGVIAIARSLGCQLVAEGVETRQQRAALLQAGCRLMQGYLFGAPDVFERWHPIEPTPPREASALLH